MRSAELIEMRAPARHLSTPMLALIAALLALGGCGDDGGDDDASGSNQSPYARADLRRGAQLYDTWWEVPGVQGATEPGTNPGYALTAGTQTGSVTWRCKECHGWDYRGRDGAYATGSHATGVMGLLRASVESPTALFTTIRNGVAGTAMSPFGQHLSDDDIWDLVKFVREGMVDTSALIDPATKAPIGADPTRGATLFAGTCAEAACHGEKGRELNFGTPDEPEYVGTVARDNPWEFFHKVRAGQPGTPMPSAIADTGWSVSDILDVLAYARTLPAE